MYLSFIKLGGFRSNGEYSIKVIYGGLSYNIFQEAPHLLDIHFMDHRKELHEHDVSFHFPKL